MLQAECLPHGLINYLDTTAKCRHLKKLTFKGTYRQVSEAPSPPIDFVWGGLTILYIGSESGQKHSAKLLQNMVSNRT